jgi:hypothetical protein
MDHGHDRFYRDAEIIEVQHDIRRDHPDHPDLVAMRSNHGTASLASEDGTSPSTVAQVSQAPLHPPRVTPKHRVTASPSRCGCRHPDP